MIGIALIVLSECVASDGQPAPKTLVVNALGRFPTVQDAVDAARDGDTIRINARTYSENIVIDKCLRLIGDGSAETVLCGSYTLNGRHDNVIHIKRGTDVYLRGLTVRDGYEGLLVEAGSSVPIEQCLIANNYHYGIGFFGMTSTVFFTCETVRSWPTVMASISI